MKLIYVMADSLRRDHVGVYGGPPWGPIHTPNLDRFAESAAVFENAYIGSFPTVPNRRDTHLGHSDKGLSFNRWRSLDEDEVTFPVFLREKGVPSMLVTDTMNNVTGRGNMQRDYTAWAFNRGQEGERCWMDDSVPLEFPVTPELVRYTDERWHQILINRAHRRRETDWFAPGTYTMAIDWLEKNYTREDFFLWIDTFDPHEPWDPPQHYVDLYDPGYRGRILDAPSYGLRKRMGITNRELQHIRARYAAEVTMVDTWFGRLLGRLESLGIAEETAIIFNADHGTCFDGPGDLGFIQKLPVADADGFAISNRPRRPPMRHYPLSPNVARIPLFVHLPGQKRSMRVRQIVQPWDITATILDLFNAPRPDRLMGQSALPVLEGTAKGHRSAAVVGFCQGEPGHDSGYAQAMDGKWSYTVWRGERGPALHNIEEDPDCRRNLLGRHPGVLRRLQREIRTFMGAQDLDPAWVDGYEFGG